MFTAGSNSAMFMWLPTYHFQEMQMIASVFHSEEYIRIPTASATVVTKAFVAFHKHRGKSRGNSVTINYIRTHPIFIAHHTIIRRYVL
jgi:hypothetical protein